MNEINSIQNERVKEWAKLQSKKYRDKTGQFLVEGEHLIEEALKADCVETILVLKGLEHAFCGNEKAIAVSREILNKLSSNQSEVALIAVCHAPTLTIENVTKGILLDGIQDPGNMGTILRTAVSFGYGFVCASKDSVDLYNEKCVRSTQGALFQIPFERCDLKDKIEALKAEGYRIVGTALENAIPLKQGKYQDKIVIVLGNEGQGIRQEILKMTDVNVKIEMDGFESLNVAVAAGICMYELK